MCAKRNVPPYDSKHIVQYDTLHVIHSYKHIQGGSEDLHYPCVTFGGGWLDRLRF